MAITSFRFWIKFFIWIPATVGLGTIINIFLPNPGLSILIGAIIASPILYADYIVRRYVDENSENRKVEELRLKQNELELLGDKDSNVELCPECGSRNLVGTTHCNNCGKDLRVIM